MRRPGGRSLVAVVQIGDEYTVFDHLLDVFPPEGVLYEESFATLDAAPPDPPPIEVPRMSPAALAWSKDWVTGPSFVGVPAPWDEFWKWTRRVVDLHEDSS